MILFAGSYTQEVGPGLSGEGEGIYTFQFNDKTGELIKIHTFNSRNTSYISVSKNKKYLYSFQEVNKNLQPVVMAFQIEEDNSLTLINEQPIKGGLPCHLTLVNNEDDLAVACYGTGSVHLFKINEDGSLQKAYQNIFHKGNSVNKIRQEAPHAHMVQECNSEIFVPDLGIDAIVNYKLDGADYVEKHKIKMPLGVGPRHVVFHKNGNYGFVMNELTSEVTVLKKTNGIFQVNGNKSSLPSNYVDTPSGAAIQISSNSKFIYVSNRGSETIAIFKFNAEKGSLKLIGQQSTYGNTPRDFSISPNGKWMIVANQDSNSLIVFRIDEESGLLTKVEENKEAKSIVCLKSM